MSLTKEALSIFLNQPNYAVVKMVDDTKDIVLSFFTDGKFVHIGDVAEAQVTDLDLQSVGIIDDEEFFTLHLGGKKAVSNKSMLRFFEKKAKKEEKKQNKNLRVGSYKRLLLRGEKFPQEKHVLFVAAGSKQKKRDEYLNRLTAGLALIENGRISFRDDWYAEPFIAVEREIGAVVNATVHYALKHDKLLGKKAVLYSSLSVMLEDTKSFFDARDYALAC